MKKHVYHTAINWTGNTGEGTKNYRSYERNYTIIKEGRPDILGSSDPAFRGDVSRYSPEDLLLASLASCHMLWFLHFSSSAGVIINGYIDKAEGTMIETEDGNGHFEEVILKPQISITGNPSTELLEELHHKANKFCFIANSCNFTVRHQPEYNFTQ